MSSQTVKIQRNLKCHEILMNREMREGYDRDEASSRAMNLLNTMSPKAKAQLIETVAAFKVDVAYQDFLAMGRSSDLPDGQNPAFIFQSTDSGLLRQIVEGKIDPVAFAKFELQSRGEYHG